MRIRTKALISAALPVLALAQISILTTPWPTGPDPTDAGFLWPGGLIALVCTGLNVPEPVIRSHKVPLPHKLAGIRVKVGIGRYRCNSGLRDNPNGEGLDARILEVADHGDYQQVTVQVPWE